MDLKTYFENILLQDNNIIFDYSSIDGISTALREKPYSSSSKRIFGNTVLSLYSLSANETPILRAIKGEYGSQINESDLVYFAKRSASYAYKYLPKDIDLIIHGQNSFPLMDKFVTYLGLKFQSKVLKVSQSIYKTKAKDIYLKDNIPEKYQAQAEQLLVKLQQKDTIKLRNDIPLRLRMFFGGFISIEDEILQSVENKNVLIIDDLMTVGTTFSQLMELIQKHNPKSIMGLTLFKYK